jgi:hypothetical protein
MPKRDIDTQDNLPVHATTEDFEDFEDSDVDDTRRLENDNSHHQSMNVVQHQLIKEQPDQQTPTYKGKAKPSPHKVPRMDKGHFDTWSLFHRWRLKLCVSISHQSH